MISQSCLVVCTVSLRPVGDRPKTSASTARRMVANALGVRVNISKEQREKERRELQEAKGKAYKLLSNLNLHRRKKETAKVSTS